MKTEKAMRFNTGKMKWSLVHFKSLEPMIAVLMFWAKKYAPNNWKKWMNEQELLESMQRHLASMIDWEVNDKESNLPHVWHLMCNCMFYVYHFIIKNQD